jgi:prephenate dehydratase
MIHSSHLLHIGVQLFPKRQSKNVQVLASVPESARQCRHHLFRATRKFRTIKVAIEATIKTFFTI